MIDAKPDWDAVKDWAGKSNAEIGREMKCAGATVAAARRRRGEEPTPSKSGGPPRVDWDAQPLGEEIDSVIARRLGVSRGSVSVARRKRGIDPVGRSWRRRGRDERTRTPVDVEDYGAALSAADLSDLGLTP